MPQPQIIPAKRGYLALFVVVGVGVLALDGIYAGRLPVMLAVALALFGAVFVLGAIRQIFKPLPFATLTPSGIAFPLRRVGEIPWSRILDVQVGPRMIPNGQGRTLLLRDPIVLRLAAEAQTTGWVSALARRENVVVQPDGTVQQLIDTAACAISTTDLIAEIGRWRPVAVSRHLAETPSAFATPPATARRQWFAACFAVFLGLLFTVCGVLVLRQQRRERTWPSTSAVMVSARAIWSSGGHSGDGHYEPRLEYRYRIGGREYTGRNFELSYPGTQPALDAFLARYRPGTAVTIRYDPAAPSASMLGQSSWLVPLFFIGSGVAVVGVGVSLARSARRP